MAGMQDLARVGEPEFEEVQELELKFSEDLERVFEGKQDDFGDHLRGMLFELWSRARGTKSTIVKELEELRLLKAEKNDLKAMIAEGIKAQLPAVAEQFKSTFDNVMATQFNGHLINELETPASSILDNALADALMRVIQLGDGLFADAYTFGKYTIKSTVAPDPLTSGQNDDERLRERLQHVGLLPPDDFHENWKWVPVYLNTETGEKAAFHMDTWQQRHNPNTREVRVPLAWDGSSWCFPNPRPPGVPNDISHLEATLSLFIDGVEQDSNLFHGWTWEWAGMAGESTVLRVHHLPAWLGTEVVEARYRIFETY